MLLYRVIVKIQYFLFVHPVGVRFSLQFCKYCWSFLRSQDDVMHMNKVYTLLTGDYRQCATKRVVHKPGNAFYLLYEVQALATTPQLD